MIDRDNHAPLLVRWPGHILPGATGDALIDFSDFFPTLCESTGAPMPRAEVHGRSFAPQVLGRAGKPRDWIHAQHDGNRQLRNHEYMRLNQGELRKVVELSQEPARCNENKNPEAEASARKSLQAVFDALGNGGQL